MLGIAGQLFGSRAESMGAREIQEVRRGAASECQKHSSHPGLARNRSIPAYNPSPPALMAR